MSTGINNKPLKTNGCEKAYIQKGGWFRKADF